MNGRTDYIIPECYVDTNLVETLVCHGGCNHQKGCNQVAKIMKDKFKNRFAVGIIDADKRTPRYLDEFEPIAGSVHLALLRHPELPHFIVTVSPAIDGFILAAAKDAGLDLKAYGLADNLAELKVQTKNVLSNKDSRFKRLFRDLEPYGEIHILKNVLLYLADHTYRSQTEQLKSFF